MADYGQIRKLIITLSPGNRLRQLAEQVLSDPHAPIEDLRPVIAALERRSSAGRRERSFALWLAQNAALTPEQRSAISDVAADLVEAATTGIKPRNAARWIRRAMLLALGGGIVLLLPLTGAVQLEVLHDYLIVALIVAAVLLVSGPLDTVVSTVRLDRERAKRMKPLIDMLGKYGRPAALLPLARACLDRPLRGSAAPALKMVASRLEPGDYGAVPAQCVPALCRALTRADRDTALSILYALAIVGDGRAIPYVERRMVITKSNELHKSAADVVSILRQREAQSQTSSVLLRASSVSAEPGNDLLRTIDDQSALDEGQLLRVTRD